WSASSVSACSAPTPSATATSTAISWPPTSGGTSGPDAARTWTGCGRSWCSSSGTGPSWIAMPKGYEDPASLHAGPAAAWAGGVPRRAWGGDPAAADVGRRAAGTRHRLAIVSVLALALGLRLFGAIAFEGGAWQVGPCDDYSVHQISTILSTG